MALAISTGDSDLDLLRQRLAARLRALSGQVRLRLWLDVLARVVVAVAALGIVSFTLDWWLELSRGARIAYVVLAAGLVGWAAAKSVRGILRLRLGPVELAGELDKSRRCSPSLWIAPRVATVLQLSNRQTREPGFSDPLVERAVRHSSRVLEAVDFSRRLDERHLRQCLVLLLAAIAAPLLFAAIIPGELSSLWARRWILGSNAGWPRDTAIDILGLTGGRLIVPRGEPSSLRIAVRDRGAATEQVWVRLTASDSGVDAVPETVPLVKFGLGDFRFELPPQQQTVTAEFWGGDGRAGPVEIVPVDRPRIAHLVLVYKHPRDKAPQTFSFSGEEGNVRLLKQTAAELTLSTNVAVSTLDVAADGPATPRATSIPAFERIDDRTFRAKWLHQGALQLKVGMVARDSQLASRPEPIAIGFKDDRPPRVTLTHSGVGARVTPSAIIPLKVAARDDFAVTRAVLAFKIVPNTAGERAEGEPPKVASPSTLVLYGGKTPAPEATFDGAHEWDLESLKLGPGDTVSATAEATDDCYTGPQTSRSRTLAFRIVSRSELFREILLKQQQLRARWRKATDQAEALRQSLRSASLRDDADELLRRHNLIQREVWQVMHAIEDSATETRLNRLGGAETHEIITKSVIAPLERLHDDLLTRQRQALESVRQPAAETQEQLAGRQQQIVDEMTKVLKSMSQWDSFIDVVNQLTEVINLENLVRNKTEELKKRQFDSIFDSK